LHNTPLKERTMGSHSSTVQDFTATQNSSVYTTSSSSSSSSLGSKIKIVTKNDFIFIESSGELPKIKVNEDYCIPCAFIRDNVNYQELYKKFCK